MKQKQLKHEKNESLNVTLEENKDIKTGTKKLVTIRPGPVGFLFKANKVTKVVPSSQLGKAGISAGWIILEVNGEKQSNSHCMISKAIKKTHRKGKETVILFQENESNNQKHEEETEKTKKQSIENIKREGKRKFGGDYNKRKEDQGKELESKQKKIKNQSSTTVQFKSHENDSWGFAFNLKDHWSKWKLTDVTSGKQAERLGVRKGYRITLIDNEELNAVNSDVMKAKLTSGVPCTITFLQPISHETSNIEQGFVDAKRYNSIHGKLQICKHHLTHRGCRKRDICKFSHPEKDGFDNIMLKKQKQSTFAGRFEIPKSDKTAWNFSNKDVSDKGCIAIAHKLRKNTTVNQLNMTMNAFGNIGVQAFAEALHHNCGLTKLRVSKNKIGDVAAKIIAEGLKSNSVLRELNLSTNHMCDVAARAIGDALKINSTLKRLTLSDNMIGDTGSHGLAQGLTLNSTLVELDISQNEIGDLGAIAFGDGLKNNTTISFLRFDENHIEDSGAIYLANILKICKFHFTDRGCLKGDICKFSHPEKEGFDHGILKKQLKKKNKIKIHLIKNIFTAEGKNIIRRMLDDKCSRAIFTFISPNRA